MWPIDSDALDALRYPHARQVNAMHRNLVTGTVTPLPVEGGSVTVDATSRVRRSLSLVLPPQQDLWSVLDTPGGEITVSETIRFPDHSRVTVPLGVFVVDQDSIGYSPGDTLQLTCPDRWVRIQRNRFGLNRASVPSNRAFEEIQRLVEGAWNSAYPFPGWSDRDTSATTPVGSMVWDDGDREAAIVGLADANSLEVFFDAVGFAVMRPTPTLSDASPWVWTLNEGENGVVVAADRTRDRSTMRNAIIVTTSATDIYFPPVQVVNQTADDPLSTAGPLGYVAEDYSNAALRNSAQAYSAGRARLAVTLGEAKSLTLEASGNPALDARDVIRVILPNTDANMSRTTELHIIDTVTHPLTPSETQHIETRSTRPSTDGT